MSSVKVRVNLVRNSDPDAAAKLALVPATLEELLSQASAKLGIAAATLFLSNGAEVDDVGLLQNDDVVYVATSGEPFNKKSMVATGPNASAPKKKDAEADIRTHHIVMLGSGATGKSCLSLRFTKSVFVENYDPTIEDVC